MATNITLSDALSVLNTSKSITDKRRELVKLGFSAAETESLIGQYGRMWSPARPTQPRRSPYTFGIELETYNVTSRYDMVRIAAQHGLEARFEGYNHVDNDHYVKFVADGSICGNDPAECVSPILTEGRGGYAKVKAICDSLNEAGAKVNRSTGYHVHVGGNITNEQYVNVFQNYKMMQHLIDTIVAPSRRNCHWCAPLNEYDFSRCTTPSDVLNTLHHSRYLAVNPKAWQAHRTIEFRQHQGTINAQKVTAWAKFCIKLVAWSQDHRLTEAITSIDNIPFLTTTEKRYFKQRQTELAERVAEAV